MQKQKLKHGKSHKVISIQKKAKAKLVDRLIYFAAIIEPLFSLPQAYHIYSHQSAQDVSILSWIGFEFMTLIWVWYAITHREKMILVYQGLFLIIDGFVLVGAIIYGGKLL